MNITVSKSGYIQSLCDLLLSFISKRIYIYIYIYIFNMKLRDTEDIFYHDNEEGHNGRLRLIDLDLLEAVAKDGNF